MVTTLGTICTHSQPEMKIFSWLREEPVPCNKNKDICIDPNLDLHLSNFQVTPSHSLAQLRSTCSGALLINCNRSRLWPGKWNGHIYVNHHQSSRIMSFDHHWCQRTSWRCLKSRNLDSAKFVCHQAYNYFYKVTTTKRFLFLNIFTELAFVHVFQNYTCAWCALIRKTGGYHSLNPSSRIIEGRINDYIYEITNSLQHTFS